MRATITVRRRRSAPSSYLVGRQTVALLQKLGLSDIQVQNEDSCKAVLTYRWEDHDTQSLEIQDALDSHGIQLLQGGR